VEIVSDYLTVYPGVYLAREKAMAEKYLADNKALKERGEIDTASLIKGKLPKDTPGIGPQIKATEEMMLYNSGKYDPENPVLNDAAYARKTGYKNIIAYPTFGTHDDTFIAPWPPACRDTLMISSLYHNIYNYKPVYPGDTLYLVANARYVTDLTPPGGSIHRSVAIRNEGSIYNQRGEKVYDLVFLTTENLKYLKDESKRIPNPTFQQMWETPEWRRRPGHYYTEEDWDTIKDIWTKEKRQGAQPLYWEDVNIGDEPAWTLDGPIEESVLPIAPWGMGVGGSRTLKKEILDPKIFKKMIKGEEDGIYRLKNKADYFPAIPEGAIPTGQPLPDLKVAVDTVAIHKAREDRSFLVNYMGRDFAIRHINNWMGDLGWIYHIRWGIMPPELHACYGKYVPVNPEVEKFLEHVPKMKGRHLTTHGMTGDVAIVKSYIYNKFVRDGEFFVDLTWWVETIDGYIWEEGGATVKLPSKKAK
jgi:hypothetical protein